MDDDDFVQPMKRESNITSDDIKVIFPHSALNIEYCTFNINFKLLNFITFMLLFFTYHSHILFI